MVSLAGTLNDAVSQTRRRLGLYGRPFLGVQDPRLVASMRAAELAGLRFAFNVRAFATAAIGLWLLIIVPAPRSLYYLGVVAVFFLLGLVPYLLRHHRFAVPIRACFIVLDVALLVSVILLPTPFSPVMWPIQTRLRFPDYLYLLLYLGGAALTYSPRIVLWTGFSVVTLWSAGFAMIARRPDTVTFGTAQAAGENTADAMVALQVLLSPFFVGWAQLANQVVLTGVLTGILAAAVWRARRHMMRQVSAEAQRTNLSRYVSQDVAERLVRDESGTFGAPAERHVAVLFADVVGFTRLSETAEPEQVVRFLQAFHARATDAVFANGGTLDKFLGDGLMATFGTLGEDDQAAARALACAFALQDSCDRHGWTGGICGGKGIQLGIGIHYGPAVVGNVGGERRMEFTVIGDTVNVAARIERLTRHYDCAIAISENALTAAGIVPTSDGRFQREGEVDIRGRANRLAIWTVHRAALRHPMGPTEPDADAVMTPCASTRVTSDGATGPEIGPDPGSQTSTHPTAPTSQLS
jgi:adenylate cyclase